MRARKRRPRHAGGGLPLSALVAASSAQKSGPSPISLVGHFLTFTRSEDDAGYDGIRDGADTARRRAHRIDDPEADVQ